MNNNIKIDLLIYDWCYYIIHRGVNMESELFLDGNLYDFFEENDIEISDDNCHDFFMDLIDDEQPFYDLFTKYSNMYEMTFDFPRVSVLINNKMMQVLHVFKKSGKSLFDNDGVGKFLVNVLVIRYFDFYNQAFKKLTHSYDCDKFYESFKKGIEHFRYFKSIKMGIICSNYADFSEIMSNYEFGKDVVLYVIDSFRTNLGCDSSAVSLLQRYYKYGEDLSLILDDSLIKELNEGLERTYQEFYLDKKGKKHILK